MGSDWATRTERSSDEEAVTHSNTPVERNASLLLPGPPGDDHQLMAVMAR